MQLFTLSTDNILYTDDIIVGPFDSPFVPKDTVYQITAKQLEYLKDIDKPRKCECGAHAAGTPWHSDYCPIKTTKEKT